MSSSNWVLLLFCSLQCLAGASKPFLVSVTYSYFNSSKGINADALAYSADWLDAAVLIDTGTASGVAKQVHVKQLPHPANPEEARNTALHVASDMGGSWAVLLGPSDRLDSMTSKVRDFLNSTEADLVTVVHRNQTHLKPRFYRFFRLPVGAKHDKQNPTHAVLHIRAGARLSTQGEGVKQLVNSAAQQHSHSAECALPVTSSAKPTIGLGFTTAKRPAQFMRTYLSFRLRCLDCSKMVDDWYAVDDGSSADELAAMKAIAPNIKWLAKPANQSGHVGSINTLMKVAAGYDYFVWMEDDWFFLRDDRLISQALEVFRAEPNVAQVLFNPDYKETDHAEEASFIARGDEHESCGLKYTVHKYCGPSGSDSLKACQRPGQLSHYHWPHFSLRPGVWRMSHMSALGPIEAGANFERQHGLKYIAQGLKTAFLHDVHSVHLAITSPCMVKRPHIATETYHKHGIDLNFGLRASAYDLRGTGR